MSSNNQSAVVSERLVSLDALRGFDMFWIIGGDLLFKALAKGTGNGFLNSLTIQFDHVKWEGFRFEDIIMPLFLFIVGVAMPYSFNKRIERGQTRREILWHVIKRVVILWVLGTIAQGNLLKYDLSQLHLYSNTLQAIAAGYFIASIIMLNLNLIWQVVSTIGLLLVFWVLMMWVPVPGHGAGVLTPEGNLAIYIDKLILGPFYDGTPYTWILSSPTFGATVMLGVLAGYMLRSEKKESEKFLYLFATGITLVVAGEIWAIWFPIIKHIWTSSFVLYSGGLSYLLLAIFYLIIDVWELRKWAFWLVVIGTNAIAVYMAYHVFDFKLVGNIFVGGLMKYLGNWGAFAQEAAAFAVVWLILYWMYRKKSFIKI